MQIQADVRTIMSRTFASRHSLRFPRCTRVRWDKSPLDIQTDQDLWDIVESNKGAIKGERLNAHSVAKGTLSTGFSCGEHCLPALCPSLTSVVGHSLALLGQ